MAKRKGVQRLGTRLIGARLSASHDVDVVLYGCCCSEQRSNSTEAAALDMVVVSSADVQGPIGARQIGLADEQLQRGVFRWRRLLAESGVLDWSGDL